MRIDMKREAEVNERKGLTWRTLLSLVWLFLCLVLAYFATGWLIENGTIDDDLVYGTLSVPPAVNMQMVRLAAILLVVGALQFVAVIFFAMTNPAARVRSGRPTTVAQSVDYYEKQYNRQA
jgi:hypothetical protein